MKVNISSSSAFIMFALFFILVFAYTLFETESKLILTGSGLNTLESSPWVAFIPMGFLFLTVASFNYLSDRLRDYFDVRDIFVTRD